MLVGMAAGLGACASLGMGKFQEPDVRLQGVQVRSIGLVGGTVDLYLDVNNPNEFDLRGTRMQLGLDVENTHFGDVDFNDAFNLPKGQTVTVVVPLSFVWAGVGEAARSALNYGTVKYTLKGTASMQTPFGTQAVPFTRSGSVAVNGNRPAAPGN
ncbi:MAG: LEA type 2 family protein [Gemmatimonadota bacterium]